VVYNGALYFSADDGTTGYELYRYDGNAVTLVENINPNATPPGQDPIHDAYPSSFKVFNGLLYFSADDGAHGRELWAYDGLDAFMVADLMPGQYGSDPNELTLFQNQLLFTANDGQFGGEPQALLGPAVFALQVPEPGMLCGLALLGMLPRPRRK
jgi:ELWxxDGT repeat protein